MDMDPRRVSRLSVEFNRAKQEEQDRRSFSREGESGLPEYHLLTLPELQRHFNLEDTDEGLTSNQVLLSRKQYGPNIVSPPKKNPIWMWLGFCFSGFNGFLWFAAALSWVAWGLGYLVRLSFIYLQLLVFSIRPLDVALHPNRTPSSFGTSFLPSSASS